MKPQALVFDVDGTLADTEELHRRAFNAAFAAHDLPWEWSRQRYRELLRVAGGKERIRHFIGTLELAPEEAERLTRQVPALHAAKTREFARRVAAGELEPRAGMVRLVDEARQAGVALAIASTTSPANVEALVPQLLGPGALSWFRAVATGDVVERKKPAPDIYRLALDHLGLRPEVCVAFEDSDLGVHAAKAAGLYTVAVPNGWTAGHDFRQADLLLPSLGDPGRPLPAKAASRIGGHWLGIRQLEGLHGAPSPAHPAFGQA